MGDYLEHLSVNSRTSKWIVQKYRGVTWPKIQLTQRAYSGLERSCEDSNDLRGSIKLEKFVI